MKFLKTILEKGEHPICRTHLHVVYLFTGAWWLFVLAAIGWGADFAMWYYFGAFIPAASIIPYIPFVVQPGYFGILMTAGGALILLGQIVKYMTTDIVVTTKRLLYKTGLIKIRMDATDISDILGAHVDQGWFGQFFGYGKLIFDCRFIKDVNIPYVKNPYGIIHTLHRARTEQESLLLSHPIAAPAAPAQTLIQIGGSGPVYIVDKVPEDQRLPLQQLPKMLGDTMINSFRRKA